MNTYAIYEGNLERLEKRLTTIQNKCIKYGRTFHYQITGEEFRPHVDEEGNEHIVRFVLVEAEGQLTHQDWEFVAVVNHEKSGNIIRQLKTDVKVPEKYYTTAPICEHCNTKRARKDTYLIHNSMTDEWKQVGKTCLTEFTNGMDAEEVAKYVSLFDSLIQGESIPSGRRCEYYLPVKDILMYAFETVKHFGYQSNTEWENYPTKFRCLDYYYGCCLPNMLSTLTLERVQDEMKYVHFNAESSDNQKLAEDAISWIATADDSNSYMHNLKVICSSERCAAKNLGMLVSLAKTYMNHVKSEETKAEKSKEHSHESATSQFVGEVGQRISFDTADATCIYTSDSMYGLSFMYKMHDENGNVLMWMTETSLEPDCTYRIAGTVKKHEEYNDVKQTWLTRCRATKVEITESDEPAEEVDVTSVFSS